MYYRQKESGKRIKELRSNIGLTQEQLANQLNISVSNMGKVEIGYSGISIDLLIEIAMFFGVSTDYILLGKEFGAVKLKDQIGAVIEQLNELRKGL